MVGKTLNRMPFYFFLTCNSVWCDFELRTSLMSLRYGIKESDQLWVCCVFKSLCVFILFTLRGFHYLCSKSRHCSGCFPCFSLIPAAELGPSPKPSFRDWLRLFRPWGFAGLGACWVFTVLFGCSHLQLVPFPCWVFIPDLPG